MNLVLLGRDFCINHDCFIVPGNVSTAYDTRLGNCGLDIRMFIIEHRMHSALGASMLLAATKATPGL